MANHNHAIPNVLREAGLTEWTHNEFWAYPAASFGALYHQRCDDDADCQQVLQWLYNLNRTATGFCIISCFNDEVHVALK